MNFKDVKNVDELIKRAEEWYDNYEYSEPVVTIDNFEISTRPPDLRGNIQIDVTLKSKSGQNSVISDIIYGKNDIAMEIKNSLRKELVKNYRNQIDHLLNVDLDVVHTDPMESLVEGFYDQITRDFENHVDEIIIKGRNSNKLNSNKLNLNIPIFL